jgi:hypothetical protein
MHDDDNQVDLAVRRLAPDVEPMADLSFAARRALVLDAAASRTIAPRRRRPVRRWVAAAAAITAVTVGVLNFGGSGLTPPANAEAVAVLTGAADVTVQATDVPVGPGQYRYVKKTASQWNSVILHGASSGNCWFRYEETEETWIPADRDQDWLRRITRTDPLETKSCTMAEALHAPTFAMPPTPQRETRAKGGKFDHSVRVIPSGPDENGPIRFTPLEGAPAEESPVSIYHPTPEYLATFPRDPQKLFMTLRDMVCLGDTCAFVAAEGLLDTGQVPGELRAAVYQALTRIPGITVADRSANLDGRTGIAIRITGPGWARDLIVDPKTGDFIGSRGNLRDSPGGLLINSSSVTTGVADTIGAPPTR